MPKRVLLFYLYFSKSRQANTRRISLYAILQADRGQLNQRKHFLCNNSIRKFMENDQRSLFRTTHTQIKNPCCCLFRFSHDHRCVVQGPLRVRNSLYLLCDSLLPTGFLQKDIRWKIVFHLFYQLWIQYADLCPCVSLLSSTSNV